jgi:glycerate dehydrogenase
MLFALMHSLSHYDRQVKNKSYSSQKLFTMFDREFYEIHGKVFGIIGLGTIGKNVARVAQAFGATVVYYSTQNENRSDTYQRLSLDELLAQSHVVSIHAPLNDKTKHLIGYEQIKQMRKEAYLLNLGRGGIIDESGLARALNENRIAGAAIDVFAQEPLEKDSPLLNISQPDKLLLTPHNAWTSREARETLMREVYIHIEQSLKH